MAICLLCAGPLPAGSSALCRPCLCDLPRIESACARCGRPVNSPAICGKCSVHLPVFDRAVAVFYYRSPIDTVIKQFKYGERLSWGRFLAGELAAAVRAAGMRRPDCLVPVPLHWRRRYARGYNQAAEIAKHLERTMCIRCDLDLVRRRRPTAVQAGLPAADRRKNVRRAFEAARLGGYECVAVIDDVITTGATVTELARVLKQSGIREVQVWAVAHAG